MDALDELDPRLPQTPLSMLNQATTPVACKRCIFAPTCSRAKDPGLQLCKATSLTKTQPPLCPALWTARL
jgi:hypothetical protein